MAPPLSRLHVFKLPTDFHKSTLAHQHHPQHSQQTTGFSRTRAGGELLSRPIEIKSLDDYISKEMT